MNLNNDSYVVVDDGDDGDDVSNSNNISVTETTDPAAAASTAASSSSGGNGDRDERNASIEPRQMFYSVFTVNDMNNIDGNEEENNVRDSPMNEAVLGSPAECGNDNDEEEIEDDDIKQVRRLFQRSNEMNLQVDDLEQRYHDMSLFFQSIRFTNGRNSTATNRPVFNEILSILRQQESIKRESVTLLEQALYHFQRWRQKQQQGTLQQFPVREHHLGNSSRSGEIETEQREREQFVESEDGSSLVYTVQLAIENRMSSIQQIEQNRLYFQHLLQSSYADTSLLSGRSSASEHPQRPDAHSYLEMSHPLHPSSTLSALMSSSSSSSHPQTSADVTATSTSTTTNTQITHRSRTNSSAFSSTPTTAATTDAMTSHRIRNIRNNMWRYDCEDRTDSYHVDDDEVDHCASSKQKQRQRQRKRFKTNHSPVRELAVLELPVVLFPGCTIPIKLHDRTMISYIGKQLEHARQQSLNTKQASISSGVDTTSSSSPEDICVQIGILSKLQDVDVDDEDSDDSNESNDIDHADGEGHIGNDEGNDDNGESEENDVINSIDQSSVAEQESRDHQRALYRQEQRWRQRFSTLSSRRHPAVGRIGTVATITHTHEKERIGLSDNHWEDYATLSEIVITAVGTSRFRIIDAKDDGRRSHSGEDGRIYFVTEEKDILMNRPTLLPGPICSVSTNCHPPHTASNLSPQSRSLNLTLGQITAIPSFVYATHAPWSLKDKIIHLLKMDTRKSTENDRGGGLLSIVETEDDSETSLAQSKRTDYERMDPLRFSFWLANNVPLSHRQKVKLLEMNSTVERLRTLLDVLQKLVRYEHSMCCSRCGVKVTTTNKVFRVEGAEGTTSNYVNGHGVIHSVLTLRSVDDSTIQFHGSGSTENSYFPGYEWLITSCRNCGSHLGWLFRKVDNSANKLNRPLYFWGFMSSNVTTMDTTQ